MSVPSDLIPFRRKAWTPVVSDEDGDITASKFAGTAWLGQSEEWPLCPNCRQPMQLFLQLNLNELPAPLESMYGNGLLQLFYCTNAKLMCDVQCEAWGPFSKSVLVRIVRPEGAAHAKTPPRLEDPFPPKLIVGWEEVVDYPSWDEGQDLGIELDEAEWVKLDEARYPRPGDKLAGWPYWVQSIEYPNCPTCGEAMRFVFQIDSNDNLPYMFGDVGCGHITQCEAHKSEVAFAWACG